MNKHVIIGRLGKSDREPVPISANEILTSLDLLNPDKRLAHGMGLALSELSRLSVFPNEIGIDLLILAAHIHAADTRISRHTESQDSWTREVRLVVPVSDLERWTPTIPVLNRMLDFLSGDSWFVSFRQRPRAFSTLMPINPGRSNGHQFNAISLFSGGLDSMIGAIDILEKGRIPLFVSHAGDPATSNAQNLCFDVLRQHYSSRPINRFRVWLNFPTGLVHGVFPENTTRARSFLFISLGVLAATGLEGVVTLSVPENGFIALNVPLDLLRLGSYSTRTTHPFYLARWNDLSNILGVPVRIDNPYWLKTKGEMITECANSDLIGRALLGTLSCSSPSKGRWQGHGIEHCGYCLPCLVRRAAIKKALGRKTDPTTYSVRNLSVHVLDTLKSQGQQVRSFQLALAKLHAKPEIAGLIIHKPGTLSDVDPARLRDLAEVYSRGLEEVGALLSDVKAHPL